MKLKTSACLVAGVAAIVAAPAGAVTAIVFNSQSAGVANFDATATRAGGEVDTRTLVRGTSVYPDFAINRAPASDRYARGTVSTTGAVVTINPARSGNSPVGDPLSYKASGITFNFASPVNAIGFEVGDWGTCCQPSSLYISFDDGAPIRVGQSLRPRDVYLTDNNPLVFVGAFDDSGSFSKVSFWGDAVSEALYAGGTVRYALVSQGALAAPEPASWAMMIAGLGATGVVLRRGRRRMRTVTA